MKKPSPDRRPSTDAVVGWTLRSEDGDDDVDDGATTCERHPGSVEVATQTTSSNVENDANVGRLAI